MVIKPPAPFAVGHCSLSAFGLAASKLCLPGLGSSIYKPFNSV